MDRRELKNTSGNPFPGGAAHSWVTEDGRLMVDPERLLTISEFNTAGVSQIVRTAENGGEILIMRRSAVIAVLISKDWYQELLQRAGVTGPE